MNDLYKVNGIYKVNYLTSETDINKIIVFYGKEFNSNLNTLFKNDPNNELFIDKWTKKPIFSNEEIENIKSKNIEVTFTQQEIHFDDSISTIKLKIFHEMKENFSLEEMYLFALKEEVLNSIQIYQSLVQTSYSQDVIKTIVNQKENYTLTKEKLMEFINIILKINKKENVKINITDEKMNAFLQTLEKNNTGVNIGVNKNKLEKFISSFLKDENGNNVAILIPKKEFYEFIQTIPKKKKNILTRSKLDQFILNIIRDENGQPVEFDIPEKDFYDYNDILNLRINNKKYWVSVTLGKNKMLLEDEYPYIINPFDVSEISLKTTPFSLITINSNILLDSGSIINNNIYLCLAKDVLKNSVSQEYIIKVYYPFLFNKQITSLENLISNDDKLKEENKKLWNDTIIHQYNSINLFYDMYLFKKSNLNYKVSGIKLIKFIMKPDYLVKIPLDTIFKILHATSSNPLIKYNPSSKQENIFRLYADKLSTDGRKIPYLPKNTIFKLIKTIGKNKSISVYIEKQEEKEIQSLILDIYENGEIMVFGEFINTTEISILEEILRSTINPILQEMKSYLLESGYKINLFDNLLHNNIEIKNIHYQIQIEITKLININSIKSCINSAFIVEDTDVKKSIQMRFKRVSNFNKRNSQEAFVIEKQRENYSNEDIINGLLENYNDMKMEDARELLKKIINESQVIKGAKKGVSEIKVNPGFKTTISLNKFTSLITIDVENINNICYLYTIPIYLDSLVRLTQIYNSPEESNTTDIPLKVIHKLCSTKKKLEENNNLEKIFLLPKNEINHENDDIPIEMNELEDLKYSEEKSNNQNALDLFFDTNSEEEEEEDEKEILGGSSSPPSSSDKELSSFGSLDSSNEIPSPEVPSPEVDSPEVASSKIVSEVASPEVDSPEVVSSKNVSEVASPEVASSKNVSENEVSSPETISENIVPSPQVASPEIASSENIVPSRELSSPEEPSEMDNLNNVKNNDLPNEVKNIDGMNINNPYYFQERIQQRDPALILTKPYANFNAYSRVCPSTTKRQPVILNQEELDKINREHEGFLKKEDIIKYGSEDGKEFYYICPRYWCLKTNTVIDPKEMKEVVDENGNKVMEHPTCGRVIPKGEKKIKPGYYIYEFYSPPKGKEDKFKKYPGFQQDSHPKGFCLPCCFNNWNTPDRVNSRDKCMKNEQDIPNKDINDVKDVKEEEEEKETEKNTPENLANSKKVALNEPDEYIKGPDKFPLEQGRWGFLPVAVQKFLNEPNSSLSSCQISKTNQGEVKTCLLRHGIEISENQSFIACIADAMFYARKDPNGSYYNIPSIKQMKEIIISSLSIDKFITYQNGNLVTNFYKLSDKLIDKTELETKYSKTKIFTKLNFKNKTDVQYINNVINAYENFIEYLKNDEVIINFTYLWDIICKPNDYLFSSGINLVILKITNNDITNNIELLCPTNHYSTEFFETRKPSLILINEGNLFEPIYSYKNDIKKKFIGKVFSEYDPNLPPTLRGVFKKIIKPYLQNTCVPFSSMPNIYKAKRPLLLLPLIQILYKIKYNVVTQVVNYNSQVIGVVAENSFGEKKQGFIPCFPSSINETYSYNFMIDNSLWKNFFQTIEFLLQLKNKSHNEIPCSPAFKIVEEEHVVGILTETNQFIPISPPIALSEVGENNIPILKNDNYVEKGDNGIVVLADNIISTSKEVDEERIQYIKKIKLETNFYNVFRNTIRILLNDYENSELREKIESELTKPYIIYSEKIKIITELLYSLVGNKIEFSGDKDYYKKIGEVSTCIVEEKDTCNKNLCVFSNSNVCTLILPERNLITNKNNKERYYGKTADELIRYSRIQNFMFKPHAYLSLNNIGYNLKENEILMIQSLLTHDYFDNLVPALINQFVEYNSFDQAEPLKSQVYENEVDLNNINNDINDTTCNIILHDKIKSTVWQKCFPKTYHEKEYSKTSYCTYSFIIDLIKAKTNTTLTVNQIKTQLYEEYKQLLPVYKEKIVDILIIEGKKILGDQVKSNSISFSSFIYSDSYFLTNLDVWILILKYKIPCFFLSNKYLLETNYNKNIFLGYGERTDRFSFVLVPGFRVETIPSYKIITNENNELFISLETIQDSECIKLILEAIDNKFTIENYLQQFVKATKTTYQKKKPKLSGTKLIIEEDPILEKEEDIIIQPKPKPKKRNISEKITGKKVIEKNTSRKKKEKI